MVIFKHFLVIKIQPDPTPTLGSLFVKKMFRVYTLINNNFTHFIFKVLVKKPMNFG